MVEKIFFQSSLPRSGSTLLQNIFAQNPDVYATPTSGVLELVFAARSNYTESPEFKAQDGELMKKAFMGFCNKGLHGYYDSVTEKKYVVDKSRGWGIHYDFVNSFYPQPKMVCMVRHLPDILCSMEKKFRENPDKQDPIMNWAQMRGTNTPKRIDEWLASPPLGLALERLAEMVRQGIDKNIFFIKYEELTLYPGQTMSRVYDFLGIPYFSHDFDNVQQATEEDDSIYGIYGDHVIRKQVKPLKSDAERILGKDVVKWIMTADQLQWYHNKFGYNK